MYKAATALTVDLLRPPYLVNDESIGLLSEHPGDVQKGSTGHLGSGTPLMTSLGTQGGF
jgi:hypothetical protein